MACKSNKCLLCKHSITGKKCKDKDNEFILDNYRQLDDKRIVCFCRIDYLERELDKLKNEKFKSNYKEAIKQTKKELKVFEKELNKIKIKNIQKSKNINVKII